MGLPTPPADIITAAMTFLSKPHKRKVAVKTWKLVNKARLL